MKKFQFKSIDVDAVTGEVQFRDPQLNPNQMGSRKEMIEAWNEECRLRETELEIYRKTYNNRS